MAKLHRTKDNRRRVEWKKKLEHQITSSSQASEIDVYGSRRYEAIWQTCNVCGNKSHLLTNSFIVIHDKSPSEEQTSRWVNPVGSIFGSVILPSYQWKKSYWPTEINQERNRGWYNVLSFCTNKNWFDLSKSISLVKLYVIDYTIKRTTIQHH